MVTHDRYFLNRVTNRIVEIDKGKLYSYDGNYSIFLQSKLEREEILQSSERKRQNLFRNELAWIKRGAKARTTKQKARIDRFQKLTNEKPEIVNDKIQISSGTSRLGKKIIELENIEKKFSNVTCVHDFNYIILRDDRIGIIGPNGIGKSTLLNMVSGKMQPDAGSVIMGQTVKVGYFSQESGEMDENLRVIDYIKEIGEFLSVSDGSLISASQMLERFLFPPSMQWSPISKLSGGEKRRLYLLYVLMGAPNVLLLDEPTNDLDIQTLTILEDYLDDLVGAVIAVSHDRYFLDRISDKIFAFEGDGIIKQYPGNYSDYLQYMEIQKVVPESNKNKEIEGKKNSSNDLKKEPPAKFTYKEQKEYEMIEGIIQGLEEELDSIKERIDLAGSDYSLLQELITAQQETNSKMEDAMERWSYLNELAEKIARNSNK